ncbi:MAG TPA: L-threonylcarbamoyladenylate synthase [Acidobacteriota bacterium]
MKTEILRLDPKDATVQALRRVVRILRGGGLIVFPTDTFYGLGGDGFSPAVIRRIFRLKLRDTSRPLLVLVSDLEMVRRLARDIPPVFWKIAEEFWPGPLTIALRASAAVPSELCGGGESLAVRLPAVFWLRELVREAGVPVIATSANISGEGEISTAEQAHRIFAGKVELIVEGGMTPGGAPSTVLDLTAAPPRVIREGAVSTSRLDELFKQLGLVLTFPSGLC